MKKTTKILTFLILTALSLSFIFGISAFALSEDVSDTEQSTEMQVYGESTEESTNVFESIFDSLESYASEILSALAFAGSIIIMLCYKRGLMPVLNDGVRALKCGVKSINEKSESFNAHAIAICDGIDERLGRAESMAEDLLKSNELVEKRLSELQGESREREKLSIILSSQIDMLYEIFMSAALPQYLKDSVGEKISEMKSALGKEVRNDSLV